MLSLAVCLSASSCSSTNFTSELLTPMRAAMIASLFPVNPSGKNAIAAVGVTLNFSKNLARVQHFDCCQLDYAPQPGSSRHIL